MKHILAIDPGANGGIAWSDGTNVDARKMPDGESDLKDTLKSLTLSAATEGVEKIAVVEDQTGFTVGQQSGPAMFTFGRHFGFLLATLECYGWRVELVRPQKWQKALGLGTREKMEDKEKAKKDWKNKLKEHAARLYPGIEVTLATADALLVMEYARKGEK